MAKDGKVPKNPNKNKNQKKKDKVKQGGGPGYREPEYDGGYDD